MKKILAPILGILLCSHAQAQTDSAFKQKPDTIRVGNMVIVNDKDNSNDNTNKHHVINVNLDTRYKRRDIRRGVKIYAQNDTLISVNDDTVKVGRLHIIKSQDNEHKKDWQSMIEDGDFGRTQISIQRAPKKLKPISTNWWIFDLGFANLVDKTEPLMYYALPYQSIMAPNTPSSADLKLKNTKSSNVNIWIVQQKLNLYKHYLNLKYGVGIEMYNFRFEQPISFSNTPGNYVYFDNVHFRKDKLFVEYLTVPVQLNFTSNPENNKSFYASIGMSAGYLVQSHTKQISEERGKRKVNGNFNLNNYKLATIGELGVGSIRLYGSYSMTNLFDKNLTNMDMAPFAVGLRFSKF